MENYEYEYKGFKYCPWEDIEPEECIKIMHDVKTPEGKTIHIDWTPYRYLSETDFQIWIDLGMPGYSDNGNFNLDRRDLANFVGRKAFRDGRQCVPAHDPVSILLVKSLTPREATEVLAAWLEGWHFENLQS